MLQKSAFLAKSLFQQSSRFFSSPAFQKQATALVVGAGLSGLSTAIKLRQMGIRANILEKKPYAGGLCHSITVGQSKFEIGCNCFGKRVEELMADMGVQHEFKPVNQQIILPHSTTNIPLNASSAWNLFYPFDLARLVYNIYQADPSTTLESITSNLHHTELQDILYSMSYSLATPPDELPFELIKEFVNNDDGYNYPVVSKNGTSALFDSMLSHFTDELDGKVFFNSKYNTISTTPEGKKRVEFINTQDGEKQVEEVDIVVSSNSWERYPKDTPSSLSVSSLLLEVNDCKLIDHLKNNDIHTAVFLPSPALDWLKTHNAGEFAKDPNDPNKFKFGFHVINNSIAYENKKTAPYALSIYFLTPRNMSDFSPGQKAKIKASIIETINNTFAGFEKAVGKHKLLSPADYLKLELNSAVTPCIPSTGSKLPAYDDKNDMFFVGNGIDNVANHALGAIDSADLAIEEIKLRKKELFGNTNSSTIDHKPTTPSM